MVEFWCSERCQLNWDRDAAGLAPVKPWAPYGYVSPVTRAGGFLIPAVERAAPEVQRGIERLLVDALTTTGTEATPPPTGTSPIEAILRAYDHIEAMPPVEPVKLTRTQLDAIRVESPPSFTAPATGAIDHLMGRRIELVDTEEESTLFASANAENQQVASDPDPARGWLARLFARLFGRTP